MSKSPRTSIVIPVYNEESILRSAVEKLIEGLEPLGFSYEIILAENGSRDRTVAIASQLRDENPQVRLLSIGEPNYGKALKQGILEARGELVLCDEIDLCDIDFHQRAMEVLEGDAVDMVIGSKLIRGAEDERSWLRHAGSVGYTAILRILLGFSGTDTHGLKAFKRSRLLPIVGACQADKDVFASELVIRAYRQDVSIREIPVRIVEIRPPSIPLSRRVPAVLKSVAKLTWSIRIKG